MRLLFAALALRGALAQLSGCTSDVVRYMEKVQVSLMAAAAEAADYLPISRCDCVLDQDTKETPLHRIVNLVSHGGVAPGPLTVIVEALLAKHGDLSAQDASGATPLHLAAFHGEVASMSVLAWAASRSSIGGLIFGIKDAEGLTPLAKALKAWKVPAARILALSGAPAANATLQMDCRPDLVEAVLQSEPLALNTAVAKSPAPEAAGDCLVPPNPGRNSSLLHLATELANEDGSPDVIRILLTAGAKVVRADSNGDSALNGALREDSSEVVSMMLAAEGGSSLLSQKNRQGQSALHLAAAAGASNSLRLLVVEGADTEAQDAHGKTALQYAEQRGDAEAIQSISIGSTLKAAGDDSQGRGESFKSSALWTQEDEAAVEANMEGLSTELIAAVIVAVAGGGLCLVLFVCMLRRRFGRRKKSMVAQEAKPERPKQVWTEQTEELPKNRTFRNEDRRDSNEVHQLPGSALKPAVVVQTTTTSTPDRSPGESPRTRIQAGTPKARSDNVKGKGSQGPRHAAKAESPAPVPDRPQRKAKAKSRSRQPKQ